MRWFMMDGDTPVVMSSNREYAYSGQQTGWASVDVNEILADMRSQEVSEQEAFLICKTLGISWDLIPIQVLSKHY